MDIATIYIIISIFTVGIGGIGAIIRGRNKETAELAATRGERIYDLEAQVQRLEGRIAKLEGAYEALQGFKAQEIADAVVAKLLSDDGIPI